MGFTSFKVKIGRDLTADLAALDAVARVVPHGRFLPDANAGLTVDEALAYVDGARARGLVVETRLGMTTAAHLVAALSSVAFPDLDTAWLLAGDPFVGGYRAEHPDDATKAGTDLSLAGGARARHQRAGEVGSVT